MKKLRVGIIDLLTNTVHEPWFQSKVMAPNLASIMPQCVGVWAEELGHEVFYESFTGRENLESCLPDNLDAIFISCFSRASFLAYALSEMFRARGIVTILGGPHARSFADHARHYFDYVCLFTDRDLIRTLLEDCSTQRPGVTVSAKGQPTHLPGVRQRSKYIDVAMKKGTPLFRVVPMIGSLGCPYTCSFCIDATIPYKPLSFEQLVDDLRFAQERYGKNTLVGWHDPNFGIRFKDYLGAIEESGTELMHVAESSLSILGDDRLKTLENANFVAMLPGVESWFACDDKGGAGRTTGEEKMKHVSDHIQRILARIPYVQANFVLGIDDDTGDAPWDLTKRFVSDVPAVFPGYSLISDFQNAPMSSQLAAKSRLIHVPYPLLDNNFAINVTVKNYSPIEYYERVVNLMEHTWSWGAIARRAKANRTFTVKVLNFGRALAEGRGRLVHHRFILNKLKTDPGFLQFASGHGGLPPQFFFDDIRHQLGQYAKWVPSELLDPAGFVRTAEVVKPTPLLAMRGKTERAEELVKASA